MLLFGAGLVLGAVAGAAAVFLAFRRRARILGRFLSFAGHELNSPLTAVTMTVSNLAAGVFGATPEEQKPWLDLLREQVARLSFLVGELRDFVHFELKGGLVVMLEPTAPAEIVEDALRSARGGLVQAQIPLEVSVAEGLPEVSADADKAARTLSGLVYHARKFRSSGPISLAVRAAGGFVSFELSFASQPLPESEARETLDPLYPGLAERRTLRVIGLGLGLARIMAEKQGGGLEFSGGSARHSLTMKLPVASKK